MFANRSKERKNSNTGLISNLWQSITSVFSGLSSTSYCAGDQCFINPTFSSGSTAFSLEDTSTLEKNEIYTELYEAIKEAAKKGFLYSFVCILAEEIATEQLKRQNLHPDHIYWANQLIRTAILLSLGAGAGKTLASPIINFLLVHFGHLQKPTANYVTTAGIITFDVLTNPTRIAVLASVFATALVVSVAGGVTAKSTYQAGVLIKNSLFKAQEQQESEAHPSHSNTCVH